MNHCDQNSRSHTVARKRCEFASIRDVSNQIHFEKTLTVNIHSETLSRVVNGYPYFFLQQRLDHLKTDGICSLQSLEALRDLVNF